jgi:hypothetical protein
MTTSSTRFRNSGGKVCVRASCTCSRIASSVDESAAMYWEPTFEVMIRTVFLKSTVRPWPSVRRPSSMI